MTRRVGSAGGGGEARRAARRASPWIEWLSRAGYATNGVVYMVVGALATQAAFGAGGGTTDQEGAMRSILSAPFGRVLLGVIAVGLAGHALWLFIQAALDTENKGTDAKGIGDRLGNAASGLIQVFLAFTAGQLALGSGGGGGGSPDDWTATVLAQPFGSWLAVALGAGIVGAGLYQFYKAYKADFREGLKLNEMGPRETTWATRAGRFGYAARGVVFAVIGVFLAQAALQTDPEKARGIGGALATLAGQPFGPYLLGLVALGLFAYGVYHALVEARYHRIDPA